MFLRIVFIILILLIHSFSFALEQMSDDDMKKSTAQFSVTGDINQAISNIAPTALPLPATMDIVGHVAPVYSFVSDSLNKKERVDPMVTLVQTTNDVIMPLGLFF